MAAGDDCAVQIKINGVLMLRTHIDPRGLFEFVIDAPELGSLDGRSIKVELDFGIISKPLKGRAEVAGLPPLTKSLAAAGDLVETGVQRYELLMLCATVWNGPGCECKTSLIVARGAAYIQTGVQRCDLVMSAGAPTELWRMWG